MMKHVSAAFAFFWVVAALADMDVPRWYGATDWQQKIENLSAFPDEVFLGYYNDDHEEPHYLELTEGGSLVFIDEIIWINRAKYDDSHLGLLKNGDKKIQALYHQVKRADLLPLYHVGPKTFTSIADPISGITEYLKANRTEAADFVFESQKLRFDFKDRPTMEVASKDINRNDPLFWLKPVKSFRFTSLEKYPTFDFALITTSVYPDNYLPQKVEREVSKIGFLSRICGSPTARVDFQVCDTA